MTAADPAGPRRESFPRRARLLSARDFRACFEQGRRVSGSWLLLVGRRRADAEPARLGLAVGRKVGSAVARNRVRRRLREAFRRSRQRDAAAGVDLIAVVRPGGAEVGGAEVVLEFDRLLRMLLRKLN